MVPDAQDLVHAVRAHRVLRWHGLDDGQDGVAHRLEGLGNERRTDRARRVAAAERDHSAPPAHRHRGRGEKVASEVDHVLEIVLVAQAGSDETDHGVNLCRAQADGSAHAAVQARKFVHADCSDTLSDVGFHESLGPPPGIYQAGGPAHEQRRVRPGRLCQVLDGYAHPRLAFHQQHVTGLQAGQQPDGVGGRCSAVAMRCLAQVPAQLAAEPARNAVERAGHGEDGMCRGRQRASLSDQS